MILLEILGRATLYPSRNQMATTANLGLSTETPGREHSLPQGEETRPTLTTSAFFVSPPIPARVCGGRYLSPDVSPLSRVLSPSSRHERKPRRLRAKSHLSLAPKWGRVNGWFGIGQRIEMPCFDSGSESVSSAGPRTGNSSDRLAIAAWLRRTQNAVASARFRRGDTRCL